ncbi:MAG: hypothetical protein JWN66_2074 [Sphingomonas bacterium]|uniref:hypothetical protein n=1 Tax=Sphingomonas bacterium TaxID=1895847 RepID=UPI002607F3BB|nr:hypothetical protein [Sphingomonas bacterium]MDB5704958.1 hypothetical protein [Sphingomonas bacterium]
MKAPILAAMAAGLLIAGAASADSQSDRAVEVRATAECTVEQDPKSVAALLATLPGSPDEGRVTGTLAPTYLACSSEKFVLGIGRGSQGLYNGRAHLAAAAIVDALDHGRVNMTQGGSAAPWYVGAIAGKAPIRDYDAVALGMQEFGTCVVKAAPEASAKLVQSAAGSAEEKQARIAIAPVLAGCVAQGKPLRMNVDQLRLMIAEPLYHAIVVGRSAGQLS